MEMEEWVKEFLVSFKIGLEQLLVPKKESEITRVTFWKNFCDKRIKVEISIENGEEK